ncbi:MAG TPA: hypothetical protein VEU30_14325 [Thermoanaerobaculia bacterium]|nr:hypothetical protein [Thermoanaerobaculia bacterium]
MIAFLLAAPTLLAADFGVRAGRYQDAGETFVGAELLLDAGFLNINPNIEYSLEDDITAGSANLDLTIDIGRFSAVAPYVGAGVGLLYVDDEIGGETTDPVGNLIGGVALKLTTLTPYAQVKYFRLLEDDGGDSDEIALTIGLRF